ncbi:MAG TPA: hypothetical protein VEY91_10370, partial [Candidatus Limnocylindria bacterium]|nr:hypothetical protein [Candidatus Limnocylindria bacterium]
MIQVGYRTCLLSLVLAFAPRLAFGEVHRVPAHYPTIQAAIVAAAAGDEILVGPGTYDENLDTQGKGLWLRSEAGPEMTIVDGGKRGRILLCGGGDVIEGFTLQAGYHPDVGGAIYSFGPTAQLTIRNNIIRNNSVG